MAVAVSSTSEPKQPKRSPQEMNLLVASFIGAVLVLGFAALVLRGVPSAWETLAASLGIKDPIVMLAVQVTAQIAAAIGLIYVSSRFRTGQRATGVRGGIFFMIAVAFVGFFCLRGLYAAIGEKFSPAHIVVMLFYVVILFLMVQFFRTGRFTQWSVALDQGGWFDTHSYKRTQGLRVRRLTILGMLLIAGSGVWTLMNHNYLPQNSKVKLPDGTEISNRMGDWVVGGTVLEPDPKGVSPEENRARPRVDGGVTLLPDLQFTVPMILIALTMWFAWRAVSYPTFADFLIATEAEINKVSWASRKSLIRDTIVVLVSLFLMTFFLFIVDVFWGFILSQPFIGVLPTAEEQKAASKQGDNKPVTDW
jgi:preprotein translocase SecE subunit